MSQAYPPQPYGQPGGPAVQDHPQGTTVFVLGIVGIFFGICAPIAWYLGNKTLKDIASTGMQFTNESQIRTGRILGKVFTIIYAVMIVLYIAFIVIAVAVSLSQQ